MYRILSLRVLIIGVTLCGPSQAATVSSAQAEAKEAARAGNCTPTKVAVLRYVPGRESETVFKIDCGEEKGVFVLVQCRGRICTLMR